MDTAATLRTSQETRAELSVPGDAESLGFVRAFVAELSGIASLGAAARTDLLDVALDSCRNIIDYAFEPGEPARLRLVGRLSPHRLSLSIYETGLPLDDQLAPLGATAEASEANAAPAWHVLRPHVDEAHWFSHGREGSELRLVVYRPGQDVTKHLPEAPGETAPAHPERAPDQQYEIRRLRPSEAIGVSRAVYAAYSYSYPNEDLYYPERIVHLNEVGELVSVVAVSEGGEVVGHIALERPGLGPIAESGQAVVLPAHRGRHLLERMRAHLEDEARRLGLVHMFSEPVCSHTFSQKANEEIGSRVCGVRFGAIPRNVSFKRIKEESDGQRESCMVYVKFLREPDRPIVYAPHGHRQMLSRIYEHLGVEPHLREPGRSPAPSLVDVSLDRQWSFGLIRVRSVGARTAAEIVQARRDLVETGRAEVVYLELPLAQPQTPYMCIAAEDDGFFFSGIMPHGLPDGDALRLQHLATDFDVSQLQVASQFGREIVDYAASEWERVR